MVSISYELIHSEAANSVIDDSIYVMFEKSLKIQVNSRIIL